MYVHAHIYIIYIYMYTYIYIYMDSFLYKFSKEKPSWWPAMGHFSIIQPWSWTSKGLEQSLLFLVKSSQYHTTSQCLRNHAATKRTFFFSRLKGHQKSNHLQIMSVSFFGGIRENGSRIPQLDWWVKLVALSWSLTLQENAQILLRDQPETRMPMVKL